MASWTEQALIAAPVREVWDLVGDPNRHPEWFPMVMAVSGLPSVEVDAAYVQVSSAVGKPRETTFLVEELDELHEIGVRCTDFGTVVRITLTPARDDTFAEITIGFEPTGLMVKAFDATMGKRYCKRWTEDAIDGLRTALAQPSEGSDQVRISPSAPSDAP